MPTVVLAVSRTRKLTGGERPRLVHFLAPSDRTRRSRSGSLLPPDLLPEPRPELHMRPHMAAGGGEVVAGGEKCGGRGGESRGSAAAGDMV